MTRCGLTIVLVSWLGALGLTLGGCASIPKGMSAVDAVEVEGNDKLSDTDITEKIATAESPKFLYLFRGVIYDYSLFDKSVLQRDLERVERLYRARGYYEAKARAGRIRHKSDDHVEVTIEVEEGPVVLLKKVQTTGAERLSEDEKAAVNDALTSVLTLDEAFEEQAFNDTATAIKRALTNRGYAFAKVQQKADVDLPKHEAYALFEITPGPKSKYGAIKIEGLVELPEDHVRATLDIEPGDPYSTSTLESSRNAVLALNTFSSVEIIPALPDPPPADAIVPLLVRVREQKLKSVVLGGGFELDAIRTEFHLRVGWEHKNLFGGFRHFTVDVKPGVVLYPTRLPDFQAPETALPEERFITTLRQPGFLEARTTGVITQELNTYPVLLATEVDPDAPVIGYLEYKGSTGVERTFWKVFASPTYNFQYNLPFAYKGILDDNLTGIIVSYIDLLGHLDLRDSRIKPHKGAYLQNDFQFAGLGGDALDFRIQPEARGYIPLGDKVTIAARASVGFLFPFNYGAFAEARSRRSRGIDQGQLTRDIELIYLRGFFSGGPSSNRGYALRGVGPHGSVPFFNPGLAAEQLATACDANNPDFSEARCGVPLGGLSLWEASLELRFPIVEPFGGNVFCDMSDVSAKQADLRFNYPHLSCGLGLRYDTPIGPIRLDGGVRIPGAQYPSDADKLAEGEPGTIFGAPIALSFGIGEAF